MSPEQQDGGRWVVWGAGDPAPEHLFQAEVGDDAVRAFIGERDPGWATLADGWSLVVSATRLEIEAWAGNKGSLRGFEPYPEDLAERAGTETLERPRPY